VLGTEPDIIQNYVETGQVKLVFWPVLNHGNPSVYSTLTAECAGQQDPALFWAVHKMLFENQSDLWGAGRDYFVETAVAAGADQSTFETCYDDPSAWIRSWNWTTSAASAAFFSQPQFDINGTIFVGAQPYEAFAQAIDASLE
jgi:protein-disulfide isomerase